MGPPSQSIESGPARVLRRRKARFDPPPSRRRPLTESACAAAFAERSPCWRRRQSGRERRWSQ